MNEETNIDENLLYPEVFYQEAYYNRSYYFITFFAAFISGIFGIVLPLVLIVLDLILPEGKNKPNIPLWCYLAFLPFTLISLSNFYRVLIAKYSYKNVTKRGEEVLGVVYYHNEVEAYIKIPTPEGDRTIIVYDPITNHSKYSINQELRIFVYKKYFKVVK